MAKTLEWTEHVDRPEEIVVQRPPGFPKSSQVVDVITTERVGVRGVPCTSRHGSPVLETEQRGVPLEYQITEHSISVARHLSKGTVRVPVQRSSKKNMSWCRRRDGRSLGTGTEEVVPDLKSGLWLHLPRLRDGVRERYSESTPLTRNVDGKDIKNLKTNRSSSGRGYWD